MYFKLEGDLSVSTSYEANMVAMQDPPKRCILLGCFMDDGLSFEESFETQENGYTIDDCVSLCESRSQTLAALNKGGTTCYCGHEDTTQFFLNEQVDSSECDVHCEASGSDGFCGGLNRASVYEVLIE